MATLCFPPFFPRRIFLPERFFRRRRLLVEGYVTSCEDISDEALLSQHCRGEVFLFD